MISSFLSSGVKCCAFLDILDVITVKGIQRYPTILILWSVFQRVQLYNEINTSFLYILWKASVAFKLLTIRSLWEDKQILYQTDKTC